MAFSWGATRLSQLPSCFESILGVTVESVQGNRVYLEWIGTSGSFGIVARPLEFLSIFNWRPPPLEVRRECRDSLPNEERKWTLISRWGGKTGALLELYWDTRCSSRVEMGMSGNFLSCIKGVKDPFEAQEGRWDFSGDYAAENSLISRWGENLLLFLSCSRKLGVPLELQWGLQGPARVALGKSSLLRVARGLFGFLSSRSLGRGPHLDWGWNLRYPLQCLHGHQGFSGVSTGESVLVSCGDMRVRFPLELEKQCQASCRVDIGIFGFLSRCHKAISVV